CLVFSMEMSTQEQIERILAGKSNVSATKMATGNLEYAEWRRIQGIAPGVRDLPIWLYDNSLTLDKLLATARRWHARVVKPGQIALIVIDYLGLVKAKEYRVREQEIAAISRAGKDLAKGLNAVVMQVAQLNRNSEKEQRDPILADLRESGAIEQDANTVIFPVRDKAGEDNSGQGPARLIVAKNRGGRVGAVPVWWNGRLTKYEDRHGEPPPTEDTL
ncbi:MAG TPA: DnaB-like helicase C-terminal domain-containing protein, partial [Longimicrobium sp.]|nr:DnaB-like helicase C-terminal domain-containing protein [Longimicrobium sp.]